MKLINKLFHHNETPVSNPSGAFVGDFPVQYAHPGTVPPSDYVGDVRYQSVSQFKLKPSHRFRDHPFRRIGKGLAAPRRRQAKRAAARLRRHPRLKKTRRNLRRYGQPAVLVGAALGSLFTMEPGPLMAYFSTLSAAEAEATSVWMAAAVEEEAVAAAASNLAPLGQAEYLSEATPAFSGPYVYPTEAPVFQPLEYTMGPPGSLPVVEPVPQPLSMFPEPIGVPPVTDINPYVSPNFPPVSTVRQPLATQFEGDEFFDANELNWFG